MTPAAREPSCPGPPCRRLEDRADVEFALRALLGPFGRDAATRAAVAARLPRAPTLDELVDAVYGHLGPRPRRLALRLLDAYFHLDPPVPASGDARS
ncbi:MAG TPA: hypothetical protein VIV59_11665 [Anaeromyxobacteraceae bacterium]